MKLIITFNYLIDIKVYTSRKAIALEIQQELKREYEGSSTILEYNAILTYISTKYNNYNTLEVYVLNFKKSIEKLRQLSLKPPKK